MHTKRFEPDSQSIAIDCKRILIPDLQFLPILSIPETHFHPTPIRPWVVGKSLTPPLRFRLVPLSVLPGKSLRVVPISIRLSRPNVGKEILCILVTNLRPSALLKLLPRG